MKKIILLSIITLLLLNPVIAKTIEETIYRGNSIEVPGYNITLMGIGSKEKSIVACINNKIHILDKGNRKQIENLKIEPARIYEDYIKLKITYSGDKTCDESCSNSLCFNTSPEQKEEVTQETIEGIIQEQEVQEQNEKRNSTTTFSIILFFIVLILLIILLIKKR